MHETRIQIAIDGPASSGKGTVARLVARTLDYAYIDSGSMYRAVALLAREEGIRLEDGPLLGRFAGQLDFQFAWNGATLQVLVNGRDVSEEIRLEHVGRGASDVAVLPEVRLALLDRQRALADKGGVVMEGRDIGTVVLPDAEVKIFLDATVQVRAERRFRELKQRNASVPLDELVQQIEARDEQDRNRASAPLKQADDAVYLDTTDLTPAEAATKIVQIVRQMP